MDSKIIKGIKNGLPLTGDVISDIKEGYAYYKSGNKFPINNSARLKAGDIVISVYCKHEDSNGKIKIYINIDHDMGDSLTDVFYYGDYIQSHRDDILKGLGVRKG